MNSDARLIGVEDTPELSLPPLELYDDSIFQFEGGKISILEGDTTGHMYRKAHSNTYPLSAILEICTNLISEAASKVANLLWSLAQERPGIGAAPKEALIDIKHEKFSPK